MISFYVPSDEYGFLCNFSAHGFILNDRYWPTVEHYFQSQKFAGTEYEERIRVSRSPKEAKNLGQTRKLPLRTDWEEVKVEVMRWALLAKFTTHAELRDALLNTGNEELVENAPTDYFWGCGQLGGGQNMLGKLLMETRTALRDGVSQSAASGG
ncbi:NADAR family protein [bacterium]|nr:NADAR family protein [bacterium]